MADHERVIGGYWAARCWLSERGVPVPDGRLVACGRDVDDGVAQDQRPHTGEMLVGARRDRDFGPVVVVGAGGTNTEPHRDISVELAVVDHHLARAMIDRLRCRPLLSGWRGQPAVDIDALATVVVVPGHSASP